MRESFLDRSTRWRPPLPALARLLISLLSPDEVLFTLSLCYPENRGAEERGTLAQRHQSFLGMGWTCSEELPEECGLVGADTLVCGIGTRAFWRLFCSLGHCVCHSPYGDPSLTVNVGATACVPGTGGTQERVIGPASAQLWLTVQWEPALEVTSLLIDRWEKCA